MARCACHALLATSAELVAISRATSRATSYQLKLAAQLEQMQLILGIKAVEIHLSALQGMQDW